MSLKTRGDKLYLKGYVGTGKNNVRVQKQEDTIIPDAEGSDATDNYLTGLASNNKHDAPMSAGYSRTISAATGKLLAVGLLCMLVFNNVKSSSASIKNEIKIVNQIIMEGDKLCLQYRQVIKSGICYVKFGDEVISTEEQQDGRHLSLASGETWCTMCIGNFKLENLCDHLSAESDFERTIDKDLGEILKGKLSVYIPKDSERKISITTVGGNTECFIQLPSMLNISNDTFKEHVQNNIRLVTRFIKYTQSGTCTFKIICNGTGGITHAVTHDIENCTSLHTVTTPTATTPTDSTQFNDKSNITMTTASSDNYQNATTTPFHSEIKSGSSNLVVIVTPLVIVIIFILIGFVCIKKRDAIKKRCISRKRHYSVEFKQRKDERELTVSKSETDKGTISRTVMLVDQPLVHDMHSYLDEGFA